MRDTFDSIMGTKAPDSRPVNLIDTVLAEVSAGTASVFHASLPKLVDGRRSSSQKSPERVLDVGDVVAGRYEVLQHLSDGGMGIVFVGKDRTTEQHVALKVMRHEFRRNADYLRFRHEYYLMATLRHPSFVEVRDLTLTDDGAPCLVMEFVPGQDLHETLPLAWPETLQVLEQVAEALAFLHARRYIHHDIKPSNVRVYRAHPGAPLQAKLIDFGIMEPVGTTHRNGLAGTPAYLPPEVLFQGPSDHRLDLYSLGVMAFEMLTGKVPFKVQDTEAFFLEKQFEPPDVISLLPDVPEAFGRLIADLMAAEASSRPFDASVTLRRLRVVGGASSSHRTPPKAPPYLRPSRLVGRDEELARFARTLSDSQRAPQLLLVQSEAGLGKTALLAEFRLRARMQGAVTELASGGTDKGAFGALRQLVSGLLPLTFGKLESELQSYAPYLSRIVPELGLCHPVLGAPAHHPDPSEDRRQVLQALRGFFAVLLAQHTLALFVDDTHLADSASIEALRALLADDELKGLTLVIASRPNEQVDSVFAKFAMGSNAFVELPPFSEENVSDLLGALFGAVHTYPKFVRALASAGQYNPSLLIEIIRRLVDENVVEFRDERWQLPRELSAMPLPATLAEAISDRLRGLDVPARRVLEALAVAGSELPIELLPSLVDLGEPDLFRALDELVAAELVEARERSYRLQKSLSREELYASVDSERRAVIHRGLGELLEQHHGDKACRHAAQLAEHFLLGGRRAEAKKYLALACAEFVDAQALPDALERLLRLEQLLLEIETDRGKLDALDQALLLSTRQRLARVGLSIDSDIADRYFLLERRAFLADVPEPGHGRPTANRALRLALLLGRELRTMLREPKRMFDFEQRLVAYFTASSYHSATLALKGSFAESLDVAESLAPFITHSKSRANTAYSCCLALAFVHQGRVREAEQAIRTALELMSQRDLIAGVSQFDLDSAYGGLHAGMTLVYASRGHPEAKHWLEKFERFVAEHDNTIGFLMPNLFLTQIHYHLQRGEVRLVQEVEARYKAHHAKTGRYNAHVEMQILVGLARAALAAQNLVVAEGLCAELQARRPADFFSHGWGACVSGELWRLQRLYERSHLALSDAFVYATRPAARSYKLELRALNALADLAFEQRLYDQANGQAERALLLARGADSRSEYEELWALRTLTCVAIAREDQKLACERVLAMSRLSDACDNPLFSALTLKTLGDTERAFGSDAGTEARIAEARELFGLLGYLPTTLAASTRLSSAGSSPNSRSSPVLDVQYGNGDTAETVAAYAPKSSQPK